MSETILYFIILCILTLYMIFKRKGKIGIVFLVLYTVEAVFTVIAVKNGLIDGINNENISIFPYILIIVALLIYIYPFLINTDGFTGSKCTPTLNNTYVVFAYVYIACAVLTLVVCFPSMISMLQSANWTETYAEASVNPYSGRIQYYSAYVCNYLRLLAIITGFLMLREEEYKKRTFVPILLLVLSVATAINSAILSTSRSMIYEIILTFLIAVVFFYSDIKKIAKRLIAILGILMAVMLIMLVVSMTISRFSGRSDSVSSYVISYLGQAPAVFNAQVAGTVNKFSFGQYTLGKLFSDTEFIPSSVGGTWGTRFYMFIGWIYLDWGAIGLIIIGLLVAKLVGNIVRKEEYRVSDVYLIFSYMNILIKGVFVIGRSYCINIVATLIIYIILRLFLDRYELKIGSYEI